MLKYGILFLLLCTSFVVTAEQPVKIFKTGTYAQLLEQRHNKPFMLVFWSLDCPPCYKELVMLSEVMQKQPLLELVVVSTDKPSDIGEIRQKLNRFGLKNINTWVFDNDIAQQLRYEIDPGWYGELPRSYLFNAKHNRQAISGVLNSSVLQHWIHISKR